MFGLLRGLVAAILLAISTTITGAIFFPMVFIRLIIPYKPWQRWMGRTILIAIARGWSWTNMQILHLFMWAEWDVKLPPNLNRQTNYLLISNHQSWLDVILLFGITNGVTSFVRFFTKRDLFWVPIIGLGAWGLDFPMVRRYSKEKLAAHPELRGKDKLETARVCAKYKDIPFTVVNFAESTRRNTRKHQQTQSPYRHLLAPRPGGCAFVMENLGEYIDAILDVTIVFIGKKPGDISMWQMLCGDLKKIIIEVTVHPCPKHLIKGDYSNDPEFRHAIKVWMNEHWQKKDERIDRLHQESN